MKDKLQNYINQAFQMLYDNDKGLIANCLNKGEGKNDYYHVGERAIVFRFACYLQNIISADCTLKQYNLDCEYNRNGIENKILPSFPNGTYPDLIIHKRGSNDDNLLVMEFKTYWNSNRHGDIEKIKEFMATEGDYKFAYGISVLINKNEAVVDWISL